MPEESDEQGIEAEMLRMMEEQDQEEGEPEDEGTSAEEGASDADLLEAMVAGDEGQVQDSGGDEDDLEAQMLQAMMAETGAESETEAQEALDKAQSLLPGQELSTNNLSRLIDIKLSVAIELGRTEVPISMLLGWTEGSLIELEKVSGEPVEVLINGKFYGRGEVVVVSENFGVRLTEIAPAPPVV